ncbi:uncharacterized protein I303_106112 [Kwoniella dejecticola CBS 10117]|uniref:RRM domain-containing protein n=1 Tax=Kwoniella dejecticola CBS 10117 TaxID=1296121 RepID=A0AAJ8KSH7_9TREE
MSNQAGYNYTPEEQAAAYYAQQGYTQDQITAALGTGTGTGSSSSASASASSYGYGAGSSNQVYAAAAPGQFQTIQETDFFQQSTAYDPSTGAGAGVNSHDAGGSGVNRTEKKKADIPTQGQKKETVIRKGNGKTWEDPTLVEWDPKWFRLFVGDVSNDVNERTLDEAFGKYASYCKSKVVRDRLSLKAKYGFIAFKDPEDFLKAWKEMDGKYVGNRPIRLSKIKDDKYGKIDTVQIGNKKARQLEKIRKNKGKPLDGRPTPW